jgi:hypothetical protein
LRIAFAYMQRRLSTGIRRRLSFFGLDIIARISKRRVVCAPKWVFITRVRDTDDSVLSIVETTALADSLSSHAELGSQHH